MVKAIWIDARSQPNLPWISGTNKVHAYWMLAVAIMQTMPTASCSQRLSSKRGGAPDAVSVGGVVFMRFVSVQCRAERGAARWGLGINRVAGKDRDGCNCCRERPPARLPEVTRCIEKNPEC